MTAASPKHVEIAVVGYIIPGLIATWIDRQGALDIEKAGDPTASHIHAGAAGVNGPVVLPFGAPLTSPYSKTFTAADYQANPGAPPDFAAFVTALRAGGAAYINIHTAACKPGELRGEIQ